MGVWVRRFALMLLIRSSCDLGHARGAGQVGLRAAPQGASRSVGHRTARTMLVRLTKESSGPARDKLSVQVREVRSYRLLSAVHDLHTRGMRFAQPVGKTLA